MKLKDPTPIEFEWIDAAAYIDGAWCDGDGLQDMMDKWESATVKERGWLVRKTKRFVWICRGWSHSGEGYLYSGLMMIPKAWVIKK